MNARNICNKMRINSTKQDLNPLVILKYIRTVTNSVLNTTVTYSFETEDEMLKVWVGLIIKDVRRTKRGTNIGPEQEMESVCGNKR